jgi:hypothetical protein
MAESEYCIFAWICDKLLRHDSTVEFRIDKYSGICTLSGILLKLYYDFLRKINRIVGESRYTLHDISSHCFKCFSILKKIQEEKLKLPIMDLYPAIIHEGDLSPSYSGSDVDTIYNAIHAACKGFGTDEKYVYFLLLLELFLLLLYLK